MEHTFRRGIYRHYKGREYDALYLASDSEEPSRLLVVYRARYGEQKIWVRPLSMWNEMVETDAGNVRRFSLIGPLEDEE